MTIVEPVASKLRFQSFYQRLQGDVERRFNTGLQPVGNELAIENRGSFILKDVVNVYPDTLCWIRDFTYSYNEPTANMYFWHPSFDNYPVVGINWKQANAFCIWRTSYLNQALLASGQPTVQNYRLPIEAEWEYAARGGLDHSMYPWGGVYLRNKLGCLIANFKPLRGNYTDDGSMYPARVGYYTGNPNEYGLYDMAGNVAEWTCSMRDPDPRHSFERCDSPYESRRRVYRNGGWSDDPERLSLRGSGSADRGERSGELCARGLPEHTESVGHIDWVGQWICVANDRVEALQ